jgi:hypothetical protein
MPWSRSVSRAVLPPMEICNSIIQGSGHTIPTKRFQRMWSTITRETSEFRTRTFGEENLELYQTRLQLNLEITLFPKKTRVVSSNCTPTKLRTTSFSRVAFGWRVNRNGATLFQFLIVEPFHSMFGNLN